MYARGVYVNLTPLTSNRGALATDARGCNLWRYLLEPPPPTWESRVRDPLGTRYEFGLCGPWRGCYTYIQPITRRVILGASSMSFKSPVTLTVSMYFLNTDFTSVVFGEMLNNNQVKFAENNLIIFFNEFLKHVYRAI